MPGSPSTEAALREMLRAAGREPLGVDISDYSDEFCQGFLRGQVNVLEEILREHFPAAALRERPSDAALVAYAADALRILENAHYPSTGDEDSPDAFAVIEGLRDALAPDAPKEDA